MLERITEEASRKFGKSLNDHIRFVREAGNMIGVDNNLLMSHDSSKRSKEELTEYIRHFFGAKDNPDGFARAWIHHIHCNPHHWQYWIFPDGYTPDGSYVENGIIEMPAMYILEMVADWMGASMAYTGSWDMAEWLINNLPKVKIHSKSKRFLYETLDNLGYGDIVWTI